MKKPLSLFLIGASLTTFSAAAQINSPDATGYLARGIAMFEDNNYIGALDQFGQARRIGNDMLSDTELSEIERLTAIAAVRTGRSDGADLVERWLNRWSGSPYRADIEMLRGDILLGKGQWADALKVYDTISPEALSPALHDDFVYHRAFANLKLANFDEALNGFNSLRGSREYGNASRFYAGYIAYTRGDYREAMAQFDTVNRATMPGTMADFFVAQIEYVNGEYEKALKTARTLLGRQGIERSYEAQANRIVGEALYQTGRGGEAIPYLKKYVSAVESPELSALYVLGVAEYGEGEYEAAVKSLSPVTDDRSAMGQSAYLYIGQALLKQGDNSAALMAFNRALTMDSDPEVTETAYYNYAVAKVRGGNAPFSSSVSIFEDFLNRYPNSRYAEAVGQYIVDGYLNDDNYEAAWASLNRIKQPGSALLGAKQKIAYTLGTRLVSADRADEGLPYLREAEKLSRYDAATARETQLALGEAMLRSGQPSEAISYLENYLKEAPSAAPNRAIATFDLGYALMGTKDWTKAGSTFERLLDAPGNLDEATIADAWTRLGDTRYYRRQWKSAAEAYDNACRSGAGDYPLFQRALMEGYLNQPGKKLTSLETLFDRFPTSSLIPDALLEMAETGVQTKNNELTASSYRRLIDDFGDTTQGRRASLYLASDQAGTGDIEGAIATYEALIRQSPTSEEATRANEAVKRLHAERGTLDAYNRFLAEVENVPALDAGEAERLAWDAAERAVLDDRGVSLMEQFIENYPDGVYTPRGVAYLMDDAVENDNNDEAYRYASMLVGRWSKHEATEDALIIKAKTDYSAGRGMDALASWELLDTKASTPANKNMARIGIMRIARDLGDADRLLSSAEAVLSSSTLGSEDKTEAEFSRGLALDMKGDHDGAFAAWKPLSSLVDDLYGAKAAVYAAQNRLDNGNPALALEIAESFIGSGTVHTYWLGRGFIVLSDALSASGRQFEANEYLKALKENYPGEETDIFEMIEERMK